MDDMESTDYLIRHDDQVFVNYNSPGFIDLVHRYEQSLVEDQTDGVRHILRRALDNGDIGYVIEIFLDKPASTEERKQILSEVHRAIDEVDFTLPLELMRYMKVSGAIDNHWLEAAKNKFTSEKNDAKYQHTNKITNHQRSAISKGGQYEAHSANFWEYYDREIAIYVKDTSIENNPLLVAFNSFFDNDSISAELAQKYKNSSVSDQDAFRKVLVTAFEQALTSIGASEQSSARILVPNHDEPAIVKEQLTSSLLHKLDETLDLEAMRALAKINPGALISWTITHEENEEDRIWGLFTLAEYASEDLTFAAESNLHLARAINELGLFQPGSAMRSESSDMVRQKVKTEIEERVQTDGLKSGETALLRYIKNPAYGTEDLTTDAQEVLLDALQPELEQRIRVFLQDTQPEMEKGLLDPGVVAANLKNEVIAVIESEHPVINKSAILSCSISILLSDNNANTIFLETIADLIESSHNHLTAKEKDGLAQKIIEVEHIPAFARLRMLSMAMHEQSPADYKAEFESELDAFLTAFLIRTDTPLDEEITEYGYTIFIASEAMFASHNSHLHEKLVATYAIYPDFLMDFGNTYAAYTYPYLHIIPEDLQPQLFTHLDDSQCFYLLSRLLQHDNLSEQMYAKVADKFKFLEVFASMKEFQIYAESFQHPQANQEDFEPYLQLYRSLDPVLYARIVMELHRSRTLRSSDISSSQAEKLNHVFSISTEPVKFLLIRYPTLLDSTNFHEEDLAFFNNLFASIGERTIDIRNILAALGVSPETQHQLNQSLSLSDCLDTYALIKFQEQKTGMSTSEIIHTIEMFAQYIDTQKHHRMNSDYTYNSSYDNIYRVINLAKVGYWSENLACIFHNREQLLEAIRDNGVVSKTDLQDILGTVNVAHAIETVVSQASMLSTTMTEKERLANLAIARSILPWAYEGRHEIRVGNENVNIDDHPEAIETLHEMLIVGLKASCEATLSEKLDASERNAELARIIANENDFPVPEGTLVHQTGTKSVPTIILTGNVSRECLGQIAENTDSYPGYVDLQKIDAHWGVNTVVDLFGHTSLYGNKDKAYLEDNAWLVYLPDAETGPQFENEHYSGHKGHILVPGAVESIKLSVVIIKDPAQYDIEAHRNSCAITTLYIPVFDVRTRTLLYSYDEFISDLEQQKRFRTLNDLVFTDEVFSEEIKKTSNTADSTIAEHINRVVTEVHKHPLFNKIAPETQQLLLAAAKLHDIGKISLRDQEYSNVEAAGTALDAVMDLNLEQRRQILLLIKHDELLGQILRSTEIEESDLKINAEGQKKIEQFKRVFKDPQLRKALRILYESDVRGISDLQYELWQVEEKLKRLIDSEQIFF